MKLEDEIKYVDKIFDNSISKNLKAIYNTIVPFGEVMTTNAQIAIDKFTKRKHKELLERILSDNEIITTIDVNDIEFIMNFKKTLYAVNKLSNNDKLIYFANLLKNGYLKENRILNDEYEESLRILSQLSYRELNYVAFLYKFEQNNSSNKENYWKKFICEFEKEFNINKFETYEIYKRISNLGLINEKVNIETNFNNEESETLKIGDIETKYFYITEFFKKIIKLIELDK